MSYKNLDCYDQYCDFLTAALEDIGYKIKNRDKECITIENREGDLKNIHKSTIYFLMGATVGTIIRFMSESNGDE